MGARQSKAMGACASKRAMVAHTSLSCASPSLNAMPRSPQISPDLLSIQCSHWCMICVWCRCRQCISAVERGVTRAHLLPPWPGAMIQELYTTDGIGTLIAGDAYNGIRLATASDVPGARR